MRSSQTRLEPHIEKITVEVSTDKDQFVPAFFLSPGPMEFSLKEHVNALEYETLTIVLDTQNTFHFESCLPIDSG